MQITKDIEILIDLAISEDYISGDPTTKSLISPSDSGSAIIVSDQEGVLAGIDVALFVFSKFSSITSTKVLLSDGDNLKKVIQGAYGRNGLEQRIEKLKDLGVNSTRPIAKTSAVEDEIIQLDTIENKNKESVKKIYS